MKVFFLFLFLLTQYTLSAQRFKIPRMKTKSRTKSLIDRVSNVADIYEIYDRQTSKINRDIELNNIYNNSYLRLKMGEHSVQIEKVMLESGLISAKEYSKRKLARDYRIWSNSNPDLSSKFGKKSKFNLDRTIKGLPNNSYFQKSYAAGKKEFHKTHPLKNYDLEEKDLITIHDIFGPYVEKDISKIFIEYEKPDLSLNSIQGKTSNDFKEDLFLKFLKSKSAIEFEDPQNTMNLNAKYDKTMIWKLTP